MKPELITIPEFCKLASIGKTNAYRIIREGQVKAVKIGKKTLIVLSSVEDWINSLTPYTSPQSGQK